MSRSYFFFVFTLLGTAIFISAPAAAASKKVKGASGKTSDQTMNVTTGYCDTYSAYEYNGANGAVTAPQPGAKGTVTDPIPSNGNFYDPGAAILTQDNSSFQSDGSDLTRLFVRLFVPPSMGGVKQNQCDPKAGQPSGLALDSIQYLLVHVVHWEIKDKNYTYTTANSQWYIFNRSDKKEAHRQFPFTFHPYVTSDLRMFGSSNAYFLAIHLAPKAHKDPRDQFEDFQKNVRISYKLKVQKIEPANLQDFKALVGVVGGIVFAEELAAPRYDGLYGFAKVTGLENLPVQITSAMDATRMPAPVDSAGAAGGTTASSDAKNASSKPAVNSTSQPQGGNQQLAGTQTTQTQTTPPPQTGCPSTQNTTTSSPPTSPGDCTESATVQDEGLYRWDVSVGVPFKSYKDLQDSNGSLTTQTVSRQTAYGFLVFAPWKEDVVTPPSLGIPHILAGVPFTGKVLDSPFVGLGETINFTKIPGLGGLLSKLFTSNLSGRFYAGLSENKVFGPAPATGVNPPYRWVGKLQYGIEFSIRDVASKLSGSNQKQSGGN